MTLTTESAIVTGAGSGIGRAIALVLAAEGASVAVVDIDQAVQTLGGVHVLVNNAGIIRRADVIGTSVEEWDG